LRRKVRKYAKPGTGHRIYDQDIRMKPESLGEGLGGLGLGGFGLGGLGGPGRWRLWEVIPGAQAAAAGAD
jgi:hypothetical protein